MTLGVVLIGIITVGMITVVVRFMRRPTMRRSHKRHRFDTWD